MKTTKRMLTAAVAGALLMAGAVGGISAQSQQHSASGEAYGNGGRQQSACSQARQNAWHQITVATGGLRPQSHQIQPCRCEEGRQAKGLWECWAYWSAVWVYRQ